VVLLVTLLILAALTLVAVPVVLSTVRGRGRWGINLGPVHCPRCGEPAQAIRRPKNWRQAMWGGTTCEKCGLEYDKWGQPVAPSQQ